MPPAFRGLRGPCSAVVAWRNRGTSVRSNPSPLRKRSRNESIGPRSGFRKKSAHCARAALRRWSEVASTPGSVLPSNGRWRQSAIARSPLCARFVARHERRNSSGSERCRRSAGAGDFSTTKNPVEPSFAAAASRCSQYRTVCRPTLVLRQNAATDSPLARYCMTSARPSAALRSFPVLARRLAIARTLHDAAHHLRVPSKGCLRLQLGALLFGLLSEARVSRSSSQTSASATRCCAVRGPRSSRWASSGARPGAVSAESQSQTIAGRSARGGPPWFAPGARPGHGTPFSLRRLRRRRAPSPARGKATLFPRRPTISDYDSSDGALGHLLARAVGSGSREQ